MNILFKEINLQESIKYLESFSEVNLQDEKDLYHYLIENYYYYDRMLIKRNDLHKQPNQNGIRYIKPNGTTDNNGYRVLYIKGKKFLEHRLIWLYHYGRFPKLHLDHINHNPQDNRIENLREVSPTENAKNRKKYSNNRSGYSGIQIRNGKYIVQHNYYKKPMYFGSFDSLDEALIRSEDVKRVLQYHQFHGIRLD